MRLKLCKVVVIHVFNIYQKKAFQNIHLVGQFNRKRKVYL